MDYTEFNLRLGYKKVSDKTFVPLCQGVIASLTDNADYPDVGTLLDELKPAVANYIASIPAAQDRSPARTAVRDTKREVVKILMRTVGFYCLLFLSNQDSVFLTISKATGMEMFSPFPNLSFDPEEESSSNGLWY